MSAGARGRNVRLTADEEQNLQRIVEYRTHGRDVGEATARKCVGEALAMYALLVEHVEHGGKVELVVPRGGMFLRGDERTELRLLRDGEPA